MSLKKVLSISLGVTLGMAGAALAQHPHDPEPAPGPASTMGDDVTPGPTLFQSDMALMTGMVPAQTLPADSGWHLMDLGVARLSFNRQGGPSGGSALESVNWNMAHLERRIGSGQLTFMLMNSLEPATFSKFGSRELFQTGESYRGQPLVDRQHPHDFFMNLSATYRLSLGADAGAWLQVAPVGEPALGPTAFMHRASAGDNLTAPLGHHWQDSTHIAFNVVTAGGGWNRVALDVSVFHGREPDEHRWNIDGGSIDSASGRVRLFLGAGWSAEVSHGYLKNPELLQPGNTHRTTAALFFGAEGDRPFAATLLWGRNVERHGTSDAYLVEAAWQATIRDQAYFRGELVQKDADLLLTKRVGDTDREAGLARVGAFTLGYVRDLDLLAGLRTGAGADFTLYTFPASLDRAYGSRPSSVHAFLRVRWGNSHGANHAGHAGMSM